MVIELAEMRMMSYELWVIVSAPLKQTRTLRPSKCEALEM